MSNFLAVDTSSKRLTVFAQKGERRCLRYIDDCATRHSIVLMDEIDRALDEINLSPKECDFFAAVTGPGSFTGIRIGISAVKGLALGTGAKLVAITSFDLAAYNVKKRDFIAAVDAGRGFYYAEGYGKFEFAPKYLSGAELENYGAEIYAFEELGIKNYIKLDAGECLKEAAICAEKRGSFDMTALYVRKSQAEEGRK